MTKHTTTTLELTEDELHIVKEALAYVVKRRANRVRDTKKAVEYNENRNEASILHAYTSKARYEEHLASSKASLAKQVKELQTLTDVTAKIKGGQN